MKFFKSFDSLQYKNTLILAGFALSILYVLFLMFFGMDFTDSFFHINNIEIKDNKHSTFLSYVFMELWQSLFGRNLLSFRFLNTFLILGSVFIPLLIFKKQLKPRVYAAAFVSIVVLASVFNNVCGYDAFTRFFLVLVFSFFIRYIQTNRMIFFVLMTLFTALLIGVRMPNIVVVPVLFVLFILHAFVMVYTEKKSLRSMLVRLAKLIGFFFAAVSLIVVLLSVFYIDGFSNFYNTALVAAKTVLFSDSHSSHSGIVIFNNYINDFHKLIQYTGVLFLFVFLSQIKPRGKNLRMLYDAFVVMFFAFYVFVGVIYADKNFYFYSFYTSLMVFALIIALKHELENRDHHKVFIIISIILFAMINPLGSNTGLLKVFPFLIMIFPILFIFCDFRISKKILAFALIIIMFSFYTRLNHTYEDAKLHHLVLNGSSSDYAGIKHIRTSNERVDFIDNVMKTYNTDAQNNETLMFFGKVSHIFYFLTDAKPLYRQSFWMKPDNPSSIARAERIVQSKAPVVYFLPDYPDEENRESLINQHTEFEKMLLENGYTEENKGQFKRYEP